jgi:hypothetical protein
VLIDEDRELRTTGRCVLRSVFHGSGQLAEKYSDAHAYAQSLILEVRTQF